MATTAKGHIELLPSGSYRVQVYCGTDPVTGKPRRVKRTVKTEAKAAAELANLLRAAEAENSPDDAATLALALERYLEVTDLGVSTRATNETYIRRVLLPVLGHVKLRKIGPDSLDALYAHLRRCSRCADGCRRSSTTPTRRTGAIGGVGRYATTGPLGRTCVTSVASPVSARGSLRHRWCGSTRSSPQP
jgi:integrase